MTEMKAKDSPKKLKKIVTIAVDEDRYQQFRILCAERSVSASARLRQLMEKDLEEAGYGPKDESEE